MSGISSSLVIQCRIALGLTQQEFGDMVGCTKRTVQRWEDRGALLVQPEAEALVRAVHPARPDLAEQIAAALEMTLEQLRVAPREAASPMAMSDPPDPIDSVVRAAAEAIGVTPDAILPAIAAAFERARDAGLDVQTVADRLRAAARSSPP
jgi:transcriptional regulator with XRE-family HTH domain